MMRFKDTDGHTYKVLLRGRFAHEPRVSVYRNMKKQEEAHYKKLSETNPRYKRTYERVKNMTLKQWLNSDLHAYISAAWRIK